MTDDFTKDRAAFEAATPGEWEHHCFGIIEAWHDPDDCLTVVLNAADTNAALIVRMHSTYLARMARIEELEKKVAVFETCIPALNDTVRELDKENAFQKMHIEVLNERRKTLRKIFEELGEFIQCKLEEHDD